MPESPRSWYVPKPSSGKVVPSLRVTVGIVMTPSWPCLRPASSSTERGAEGEDDDQSVEEERDDAVPRREPPARRGEQGHVGGGEGRAEGEGEVHEVHRPRMLRLREGH